MKKILAVLIAALMICLTIVPAQAATLVDFLPYAKLICEAIKTFSTAGADIHKAYADTLKQAMDYRMYYNQQGLAKAYEQMEVSMMNRGTPSYNSVLNTTNNTFYDMSRDYTYTYNTAYYNQTYNSYYIPVTYNNVDYNYFVTYAPTYTNITYIVDGCGDPSQAVSYNYYFQLPDGRNSYDDSSASPYLCSTNQLYGSSILMNPSYYTTSLDNGYAANWLKSYAGATKLVSLNLEAFPLKSAQNSWVNVALVHNAAAGTDSIYVNGVNSSCNDVFPNSITTLSFNFMRGFSFVSIDELRISKGVLYSKDYTPATAPFDDSMILVQPSEKTEGAIAIKSAVAVNNVRLGGVRPSYPAQGDVYISLDADKKVTSCQQYQSGTWTECQGSVCDNDTWVDLSEYSFAGQVVNEDDFAEVVDKKDDPAAGTDANPEAEATSFTVHYYKEGTTDKVRRDTVYQNLAVGAAFTASAPTVKGYKALAASAEITVTADGEHIFYYSVDESVTPGTDDGENNGTDKKGILDGLLAGVKNIFNLLFGFVADIVGAFLSGITGIISTLIEAFKAVLSLGGHFGDFLASALGFVPREIINLLIAGISVSIVMAIIKFIRG